MPKNSDEEQLRSKIAKVLDHVRKDHLDQNIRECAWIDELVNDILADRQKYVEEAEAIAYYKACNDVAEFGQEKTYEIAHKMVANLSHVNEKEES